MALSCGGRTNRLVHGAAILHLEAETEFSTLLDQVLRSKDYITPTSVQLVVGALLRGHSSSNRSHGYSAIIKGESFISQARRMLCILCLAGNKLEIVRLVVSTVVCFGDLLPSDVVLC